MIIKYFIISCILLVILDIFWILTNFNYYLNLSYKIQNEPFVPKIPAALITYVFIIISLYFCIRFLELEVINKNYLKIFIYSFIYGLAIYGIYSYTTCVFLKNYNYYNAIIDTLWGGILYSISSLLYFYLI
jgi:uncharacterized membrane protein